MKLLLVFTVIAMFSCGQVDSELSTNSGSCGSESKVLRADEKTYSIKTLDAEFVGSATLNRQYDVGRGIFESHLKIEPKSLVLGGASLDPSFANLILDMYLQPWIFSTPPAAAMLKADRNLFQHNASCGLFLYAEKITKKVTDKRLVEIKLDKAVPVAPRQQIDLALLRKHLQKPVVIDFTARVLDTGSEYKIRRTYKMSGTNKIIETNKILSTLSEDSEVIVTHVFTHSPLEASYEYSKDGKLIQQSLAFSFFDINEWLVITLSN